ncbi:MAG: Ig-like domain-containing protein [Paludibacteraceae bacterium]
MRKKILPNLKNISTPPRTKYSGLFSMSLIMMLLTLFTWQCKEDNYAGEVIGVCPEVITTNPLNGATNVVTNKIVTATFNETMQPSTINESTFYVKNGSTLIPGQVTFSGVTAVFTPASSLEANTVYTATVTRSAKDLMGNVMKKDYTWSFNTGVIPKVILTDPVEGASDVALNKAVTADFSTAMNAATINTTNFILKQGTTTVAGVVTYLGVRATFTPTLSLLPNKVYTATITNDVKDVAGNSMKNDTTWSFSTGLLPIVTVTDPLNGAVNVLLDKKVKATFSKIMNAATMSNATFTLMQGTTPVTGTVTYNGYTAEFAPLNNLLPATLYTATITTGAKDTNGYALAANYVWSFTTSSALIQYNVGLTSSPLAGGNTSGDGLFNAGSSVTTIATPNAGYSFVNWTEGGVSVSTSASYTFIINGNRTLVANFKTLPSGPVGIDLGSAANFAILAGAGITNTGVTTLITGDVGSFPTATITGLLPANVIGTLYTAANSVVGTAKNDLTTAFNDAQSRSLNAISLPGQLGGLTLAPGLYANSSTSGISGTGPNGILTLDAGGNPNAVWIFKMGSTLITGVGTSIVLAGGAQAKNIYWSVGTSATLGTYSTFYGNILADQSITLTTGAKLYGRALTRIAAVTLDSNIVTKP